MLEIAEILLGILLVTGVTSEKSKKPNVILIVADDFGWNDVSFHGSDQILTPNIDALAYNGVILNRFYTAPMCTPTRASLLTGKYPNSVGMQYFVIPDDGPWALSKHEKIMPQYFQDAGYKTHMIGKWHLGFYQSQYTPTLRGFDSFFGYYGGYIDYWSYTHILGGKPYARGFDLRKNLTAYYDYPRGTYATDLFTDEAIKTIDKHNYEKAPLFMYLSHLAPHTGNDDDPMQAPQSEIDKFQHITDLKRRTLAAMISKLDTSVGQVIEALDKKNVLNNSVIVFCSDNGGPTVGLHSSSSSNHPLRSQKSTGFEGANRNIALVYSPLIENRSRVSNEWMHVSDLIPTFASLAGFQVPEDLDGVDQWETINKGVPTARNETLIISDPIYSYSSLISGNYKLVNSTTLNGVHDGWLGSIQKVSIDPNEYSQSVLSSETYKTLQKLGNNLTAESIWNLRNQSKVTCLLENPSNSSICDPTKSPCLFNIVSDPCEQVNLANQEPSILLALLSKLENYISSSAPHRGQPLDPRSDPRYHNYTWSWWQPDAPDNPTFPTICSSKKI